MISDRVKQPFFALVKRAVSRVDYLGLYRCRMVAQSGNKFDVVPDDPRLPSMSGVTLRHGVPGLSVQVTPGAYLLLGWSGGDPSAPYVQLWEGGESVTSVQVSSTQIKLGANAVAATGAVILGGSYRQAQTLLQSQVGAFLVAASADPLLSILMPVAALALQQAGQAFSTFESLAATQNNYLSLVTSTQ